MQVDSLELLQQGLQQQAAVLQNVSGLAKEVCKATSTSVLFIASSQGMVQVQLSTFTTMTTVLSSHRLPPWHSHSHKAQIQNSGMTNLSMQTAIAHL